MVDVNTNMNQTRKFRMRTTANALSRSLFSLQQEVLRFDTLSQGLQGAVLRAAPGCILALPWLTCEAFWLVEVALSWCPAKEYP